MKKTWCPAGKTECDNYFEAAHGVFGCKAYREDGHMLMIEFEDCPWKSKIKPPEDNPFENFSKELLGWQGTDKISSPFYYRKMKELYLKHFFGKDS